MATNYSNASIQQSNVIRGKQTTVTSWDRFHRIRNPFRIYKSNKLFHQIWNRFAVDPKPDSADRILHGCAIPWTVYLTMEMHLSRG